MRQYGVIFTRQNFLYELFLGTLSLALRPSSSSALPRSVPLTAKHIATKQTLNHIDAHKMKIELSQIALFSLYRAYVRTVSRAPHFLSKHLWNRHLIRLQT